MRQKVDNIYKQFTKSSVLSIKFGEVMTTKIQSVGSLQKGSYVILDGAACRVADIQVSRPGKHGHAKVRLTAVGLVDGKKRVTVMPGHDNVDVPIVEKKSAQVLSIQGDAANVMDSESYETFDLAILSFRRSPFRPRGASIHACGSHSLSFIMPKCFNETWHRAQY